MLFTSQQDNYSGNIFGMWTAGKVVLLCSLRLSFAMLLPSTDSKTPLEPGEWCWHHCLLILDTSSWGWTKTRGNYRVNWLIRPLRSSWKSCTGMCIKGATGYYPLVNKHSYW
jgi:hypothetical protein